MYPWRRTLLILGNALLGGIVSWLVSLAGTYILANGITWGIGPRAGSDKATATMLVLVLILISPVWAIVGAVAGGVLAARYLK